VASLIAGVLNDMSSQENLAAVRRRVTTLADRFPLYSWKLARAAV
jgi:glycine/serine hydroxymethyltransferase